MILGVKNAVRHYRSVEKSASIKIASRRFATKQGNIPTEC